MYNENWDMLYRDSKSLPIKRRGEQEAHLIFENNYDEVNNGSSQYIIERYIHLGENLVAIQIQRTIIHISNLIGIIINL